LELFLETTTNEKKMRPHKKFSSLKELPSIRQLRAFSALVQTGSVRGAAEILSLTQPAVTVLLRELEGKLGVSLFTRTSKGVRVTEAGKDALHIAERVLCDLSGMISDARAYASAQRGSLKIAATSTIAQTLLPSLVKAFVDEHPSVAVSIEDCAPDQFVELIDTERVHLGIGTLESNATGLDSTVIATDYLVAAGVDQAALGPKGPISWRRLALLPLIMVRSGYGVRKSIDYAAAAAGVVPIIKYEVSLMSTALALAAKNLGVAIVPRSVLADGRYAGLLARKIGGPAMNRELAIVEKSGAERTPVSTVFVDFARRWRI